MSQMDEKYEVIAPHTDYLTNHVVLAQAWKKTHKYIRRHNWYADVLELDCSTINLEQKLSQWIAKVKTHEFEPEPMKLVLAPKNSSWIFPADKNMIDFSSWRHIEEKDQKLRPLAHLNICDQTLATAVMLCLADAVETAQGPSEEADILKAQRQNVYSYGNRLQCDWLDIPDNNKQARFTWGNSQCYRKFYEDYQMFLSRPKRICQHYASKLGPSQELYVLSIDLKGFFDHIDRHALQKQLKKIYKQYFESYKLGPEYQGNDEFWEAVKKIFSWSWEESNQAILFEKEQLPQGIPQGLVASGFLSNAYLLNFDSEIGSNINKEITDNVVLRDYCRYVDDIRIVVEVTDRMNTEAIMIEVTNIISMILGKYLISIGATQHLNINEEKTKIIPFTQLSTQNNISSLMTLFQGVLSGTPDADSLRELAGGLDGLLRIADQLVNDQQHHKGNKLELSRLSTPNLDVRDDTLKRFAGTRIVKSLRMRRGMTDLQETLGEDEPILENVTTRELLDHEFQTTARKLISCWANNPSLTLLLRCGLDLYPDPALLVPVLESIEVKLFQNATDDSDRKEVKAIEYVIADLFRAGAVELGHRPDIDYPECADRESFRQELGAFAKRIFSDRPDSPWYVKQQAALFLATIGDTIDLSKEKELQIYHILHEALLYRTIEYKPEKDWFAVSLIAQQLSTDSKRYAQWFVQLMNKVNDEAEQKELVHMVALNRPDLILEIKKVRRSKNASWLKFIPREMEVVTISKDNLLDGEYYSLLRVIQGNVNHFAQENALLLFLSKVLQKDGIEKLLESGLSVSDIHIRCANWNEIQYLKTSGGFFEIKLNSISEKDERYNMPSWVPEKSRWLYGLGRILRSCITGEYDFTTTTFLSREDVGRYMGLRSTWYSRRLGLLNSPSGLLKEQYPISPWLSELLIRLLQWPGIAVYGNLIPQYENISIAIELSRVVDTRIKHQVKYFGRLSGTPVYQLPTINRDALGDKEFRVAIVQTLLPKMNDFNTKDPTQWTSSFRARHRAHTASVCNLVRKHLKTWCDAQGASNTNSIDLIVFPELSIHPDDLWLLRRLSDATKASIFAGMTFINHSNMTRPINQAIWILRSERKSGRELVEVRQGKQHMTKEEKKLGIKGHRPYQILVEFKKNENEVIRVAGAICYDATDLALVSDLRDISDIFVVAALNQDVQTFDNMVSALQYHMYQPVILANTGEFGGSTAQAPFKKHEHLIAQVHGNNQVAISVFEFDPSVFKTTKTPKKSLEVKTSPAGYTGRG